MRDARSWRRLAGLLAALSLVATACGGGDEGEGGTGGTEPAETETTPTDTGTDTETPTDEGTAGGAVTTDVGVTEEPCPDAVDPNKGCIYLGVLSDLTEGPFAALAVPITDAQKAFWARVNEEGGIGDYEVNITRFTRDNKYNPEVHAQLYQEIKPEVLALAQTLGSPTTAAIIDDLQSSNVVAAPASWTSLWEFTDVILESGNPYCVESMNALDFLAQERAAPETVMAVHYPGDYGEDGAAGAKIWADENGAEFVAVEQVPKGAGGTTTGAVQAIVQQNPDVVIVTTAPTELAEIVGGAAAQGYQGAFIGNSPTWNPALLQSPAKDALVNLFWQAGPWASYEADTPGHQAMREWLQNLYGEVQGNDGYTSGWAWSYPLKAALETAVENGDLTRQGLVDAISQLENVDYEGMLPDGSGNFAGDPNAQFTRSTVISQPDESQAAGVLTISDGFFTGPTAEDYTFEGPCYQTVELGG